MPNYRRQLRISASSVDSVPVCTRRLFIWTLIDHFQFRAKRCDFTSHSNGGRPFILTGEMMH